MYLKDIIDIPPGELNWLQGTLIVYNSFNLKTYVERWDMQLTCKKCLFTGFPNLEEIELPQGGAHTKATCRECGAYIKFVSKKELDSLQSRQGGYCRYCKKNAVQVYHEKNCGAGHLTICDVEDCMRIVCENCGAE